VVIAALQRYGVVVLLALAAAALPPAARASVGMRQLAATGEDGPVTVFYPATVPERALKRGPFTLSLAENAPPVRGNGRLVVISHGSGGGAWVHSDLARALVAAGFVVAAPEHQADNSRDPSQPGPASWKRRPGEVSRAIDAVGRDGALAPLLALDVPFRFRFRFGLAGRAARAAGTGDGRPRPVAGAALPRRRGGKPRCLAADGPARLRPQPAGRGGRTHRRLLPCPTGPLE
jgi:hypothetical protein